MSCLKLTSKLGLTFTSQGQHCAFPPIQFGCTLDRIALVPDVSWGGVSLYLELHVAPHMTSITQYVKQQQQSCGRVTADANAAPPATQILRCQYVYLCTSKVSTRVSTSPTAKLSTESSL
jgi:hypothetical protein